jgi:hypothetical protein
MKHKLHNRNEISIRSVVIHSPVTCSCCGLGIDRDNWCLRVNGTLIHDNTICIEVWKSRHGFPHDKFRVSMRMGVV